MNWKQLCSLLWLMGSSVVVSSISRAAEPHPATIAIVDVGTGQKVRQEFLDLLVSAFGKHPEVALLERQEINRLLR